MKPSPLPVILFLQGPPSGFWPQLAEAFASRGAKTLRVNFSLGDWLYWRRRGAINYRGSLEAWPEFLAKLIDDHGVTDILYYTDRLPYHVEAARVAATRGVNCYSVEFGYLRPDWLTLEKGGMGSFSHFPVDPDTIRSIAAEVDEPDMGVRYTHTFGQEAFNEVTYNLASYFGWAFFPKFDADKYYDPLLEYMMWFPRMVTSRRAKRNTRQIEATLDQPFWLLGMQLQSDYQVRANSHYAHLKDMLEETIGSFARNAAPKDRLVVKLHPLDNGWERWDKVAGSIAERHRVADRVVVIDGGDLQALIKHSNGVLVVNSTVGLHSIQALRPTKVLGVAIYDIDGLTHQGPLDTFWREPEPVDADLVRDLVKALAATIQVKGNFYNPHGRALAAGAMADRILNGSVNEPGAFVTPPPRLVKAEMRKNETGGNGRVPEAHRMPLSQSLAARSMIDTQASGFVGRNVNDNLPPPDAPGGQPPVRARKTSEDHGRDQSSRPR
ncbi:MAG: capsular biosynthesis protein [Beijerinckiaceae bacterium]|nr:capsular biosynthesis protein [Beijerinckiaceae bacterium]